MLLARSGLEHAAATARALSANDPFLPHSLGRTASEHLLRSQHHLDIDADPGERARRRLNEWLYAIHEAEARRRGLERDSIIEPGSVGRSKEALIDEVRARAASLGESVTIPKNVRVAPKVTGTDGRATPMALAEMYTAGTALGVPSFTMRGHSAVTHGNELGLMACTADGEPDHNLGGIVAFDPTPMEVGDLAFNLLGVVLTAINTTQALQSRFEWLTDVNRGRALARSQKRMTATWSAAVTEDGPREPAR